MAVWSHKYCVCINECAEFRMRPTHHWCGLVATNQYMCVEHTWNIHKDSHIHTQKYTLFTMCIASICTYMHTYTCSLDCRSHSSFTRLVDQLLTERFLSVCLSVCLSVLVSMGMLMLVCALARIHAYLRGPRLLLSRLIACFFVKATDVVFVSVWYVCI